jgi:hypothetical protein
MALADRAPRELLDRFSLDFKVDDHYTYPVNITPTLVDIPLNSKGEKLVICIRNSDMSFVNNRTWQEP